MGASQYMDDLRKKIGNDLLLVPGVAAVIRDRKGRILLQKNRDGVWNLPAGAIDPGEKPAQAIVREIFEETGLIARPIRLIGVVGGAPDHRFTYTNGDVVESTTIVFACEIIDGEIDPQDDETERIKVFKPDDMPELPVDFPAKFFTDHSLTASFEWDDQWLTQ